MKIAVIGVGAMGCLFASRLSPLADLIMLGNWPEQLATLRRHGLTIIHTDGRQTQQGVQVTNQLRDVGLVDLALILVKSRQTERAARQAKEILSENGLALTLQNGLGNLEKLVAILGQNRATLGVTAEGATVIGPGVVRHAGSGATHLARQPATAAHVNEIASLFTRAGLETHLVDNIDSLVWGKLAVNAGINPLTALLRLPNGFLAENPRAGLLMSRAAEEAAAVASAQGIQLSYASAAHRALEVAQATAANYSSMLQDVNRHVQTEIDAIVGPIVRLGRQYGVPTPVNELFLDLIKAVEVGKWRMEANTQEPDAILQFLFDKLSTTEVPD